jgi:SlyX protein
MNETETLNARIDALETRVAHQDRMLDDLNATITAQWKEIENLSRQIARLGDQLQEVHDSAAQAEGPEPPPPHY